MISKKNILIIDAILLIGILTLIFVLVGYSQPLAIAPLPSESRAESLLFYLPKTDFVLIDDNSRFDSPDNLFIGDRISLESGKYFIKFFDGLKSEIRVIETEIDVVLEFRLVDDKVGVFNVGERALGVETYDKGTLVDSSLAYIGGENE